MEVNLKREDKRVMISVVDEGIGIPKEDIPYIFERFYRTDKSRSTKTGSTGLGLYIVRKLVKAHNGEISVQSGGGKTTFMVSLPTD